MSNVFDKVFSDFPKSKHKEIKKKKEKPKRKPK